LTFIIIEHDPRPYLSMNASVETVTSRDFHNQDHDQNGRQPLSIIRAVIYNIS